MYSNGNEGTKCYAFTEQKLNCESWTLSLYIAFDADEKSVLVKKLSTSLLVTFSS
jgi:hypothetical protein